MELLGDTGHVESSFGPFGGGVTVGARQVHRLRDSANLDTDRCNVCAERTLGSEIILDAPNGTPT